MRIADAVRLPNAEEIEKIKPTIEEAFKAAGLAHGRFTNCPSGGLTVDAQVGRDGWHKLECELFAHGIVPVDIREGVVAFAVRG